MLKNKKGIVLFIVVATILISMLLIEATLAIVSSQSRLTSHEVSRIKAYYAAKAMMNYTLEQLRMGWVGGWEPSVTSNKYACHRDCSAWLGATAPDYIIPTDGEILNNILVKIYPKGYALDGTVTPMDIMVNYSYSP